jgi:asparagine synthase (glutamine-hydrolysing)
MSFEEAVEQTEQLLIESVRLRLQADVPIGVLLSSGVDSALICWAMTQLNAKIAAFTVSTPGDVTDEASATAETAKLLEIPLQVVTLPKEDGAGIIDQMVEAYAEPFGAQSALAMLRVSTAVRPFATVLLTGDGGDDVFLGYQFYRHCLEAQRIARYLPDFSTGMWAALRPLAAAIPGLRRPVHFLDYCTGGLGAVARAGEGLTFYRKWDMLGERMWGLGELPYRLLPSSIQSARHLLSDLLDYQQRMWFSGHFMTKVDAGTMYHALEARAPLLDQKLWEFAARLPLKLRLRGNELKPVLREIVRRRIGPAVAARKKRGFDIPVERWIANPQRWGAVLNDTVEDSVLERDGWIRSGSLRQAARKAQQEGIAPNQLWLLLVLEKWMRRSRTL